MNLEVIKPFQTRPKTHQFLIDTGYLTQLDNWTKYHGAGSRQCRLTAYTNALDYVTKGAIKASALAKGYWEAEDIYGEVLARYGDTTESIPNTKAAKEFGVIGYFSNTASINDVAHALYLGVPVPIGVKYKSSGHWKTVVGRTNKGFIVDDPYGTRHGITNTYSIGEGGNNDFVSWNWLKSVFTDLGDEAGFAFFITEVNGVKTGIREDM